jgi:hypothetical protein
MLWSRGCLDWSSFPYLPTKTLSPRKMKSVQEEILWAEEALRARLVDYFINRLPPADRIRVLPEFIEETAFLDIETTGLSRKHQITTIALLRHGSLRVFIRGKNLHNFLAEIPRIRLLITYNGSAFDLPFLRRELRIDLAVPHIDLRTTLRALGFQGGQKECEKQLGLQRRRRQEVNGQVAPELWERYLLRHDPAALLALVQYNAEDVIMLRSLADIAYRRSMAPYPGPLPPIPEPPLPEEPEVPTTDP